MCAEKKVTETDQYLCTQHKDTKLTVVSYGTDLCVASTNLRSSL